MLGVFLLVFVVFFLKGFLLFVSLFFDNAKKTPCVMPYPVATYK